MSANETDGELVAMMPRVIHIYNEIDWEVMRQVSQHLSILEAQSNDPIVVEIGSGGGETLAGLALYDRLRASSATSIITAVFGTAHSIASVVLQAGRVRCISEHASILIHNTSLKIEGKTEMEQADAARTVEKLAAAKLLLDGLYAKHTGRKIETISALTDARTRFSAELAVKHGFADFVLTPGHGVREHADAWHRRFGKRRERYRRKKLQR